LHAHIFGLARKKVTLDQFHALFAGLIGTGRSMGMDQLHRMQQRVEMVRVRRGAPPPPHHRRRQHWRSWNSAKNPKHNGALGTKMAECSAPSERTNERASGGSCLNGAGERHFLLHTRPGAPLSDCCILHCCYGALMRFCIYLLRLNGSFSERDDFTTQFGCQQQILYTHGHFYTRRAWKVVNRTRNALFKRKFADIARLYILEGLWSRRLTWDGVYNESCSFSSRRARIERERGICDRRSNLD
jgi:hypothetical protein